MTLKTKKAIITTVMFKATNLGVNDWFCPCIRDTVTEALVDFLYHQGDPDLPLDTKWCDWILLDKLHDDEGYYVSPEPALGYRDGLADKDFISSCSYDHLSEIIKDNRDIIHEIYRDIAVSNIEVLAVTLNHVFLLIEGLNNDQFAFHSNARH